jgi:glyoxylase-like metal-dependent hydrolase (beta-lactamase superfamily II)
MSERKRPEAPRGEKVLPGVWRLRLALPWPGVPHGNVWAVAADGGIVLFDTGIGGKGRMRQLDLALGQVGFGVEDVKLLPGVEVETDLGTWQVYETPGHAPSHVVLHQPERKLLISGDHLLGRTVLFFDHGHSPDPVGEFLRGLDEVEPLEVDLVLPGHGRPFRDPEVKIAEARRQVEELIGKVKASLAEGEKTAFEIVGEIVGAENVNTPVSAWVLQIVLSCLDHLTILGEVEPVGGTDPQRWVLL